MIVYVRVASVIAPQEQSFPFLRLEHGAAAGDRELTGGAEAVMLPAENPSRWDLICVAAAAGLTTTFRCRLGPILLPGEAASASASSAPPAGATGKGPVWSRRRRRPAGRRA